MRTIAERNSSVDILKVLSMTLITFIHFFTYTAILDSSLPLTTSIPLTIIYSFSRGAVNIFYIASGYLLYSRSFNFKRIINVYLETLLCSILVFAIAAIFKLAPLNQTNIIKSFLPLIGSHYWFLINYIIICFAFPFISIAIEKLDFKTMGIILLCLGIFFTTIITINPFFITESYLGSDHGIVWGLYCVAVGSFIKKYGLNKKRWLLGVLLLASVLLLTLIRFFNLHGVLGEHYYLDFYSNASLFPFLIALFLFLLFTTFDIRNRVVKTIVYVFSVSSFFVYLIQEHELIRAWLWSLIDYSQYSSNIFIVLGLMLLVVLSLFCASIVIHYIYFGLQKLAVLLYQKIKKPKEEETV